VNVLIFKKGENETMRAQIQVVQLMIQETGTYNPQVWRPYRTQISGTTMENIVNRMQQANGKVSSSLFQGISGEILQPNATPMGAVPIANGWSERRLRFVMEVHMTLPTGTQSVYYFQGYTSHMGIGVHGSIDPRMQFVLNSYIKVNRSHVQTAYGLQVRDVIVESAQLVNGQLVNQIHGDVYGLRPADIFTGIEANYLQSVYNGYSGEVLNDTRIKMDGSPMRTNRSNCLSSQFVAKVVDGYQTATQLADFGSGEKDIMNRGRDLAYESTPFENPFIRLLSNIQGIHCTSCFTYEDLRSVDANIEHVTTYINLGQTYVTQLHHAGQTEYWDAANRETLAATVLSNSIPAIMTELMITKIHFRSTNHDQTGAMVTAIINAASFTQADMSMYYEMFKKRIETEILFDLTYQNSDLYFLDMSVDLMGESNITISFNNASAVTYTTPSFCDSLLTPVITTNRDNFFTVVNDFEQMMNNIGSTVQKDQPLVYNSAV
jgi:hypothetical protein